MERNNLQRLTMASIGGLAGVSLHMLSGLLAHPLLPEWLALAATGFAAVFFGGWLGLAGPLPLARAALGAAGVAVMVACFVLLASLRVYRIESLFMMRGVALSTLALATVPLPFLVARAGGRWLDYPVLFTAAWGLAVRAAAAVLFALVVWAFVLLSSEVLALAGIAAAERVVSSGPVPWAISGLAVGLGLAVVSEHVELIAPDLILRLLRLLLPPALLVIALFTLLLPQRGMETVFSGMSAAGTLIAMAALGATLVSIAVDRSDAEAAQGPVMGRATPALALILPVPGVLAAWALWLRVDQYGWTPDRLAGALAAVLALGYGLVYAAAVLRGRGWRMRIRRGNIGMAFMALTLAGLWLTPVLDATRISARDQLRRFQDGRTAVADLDVTSIGRWGREGAAALAALRRIAGQPGQEALAARLAGAADPGPAQEAADLAAEIARLTAVRPPEAAGFRDAIVARLSGPERRIWRDGCLVRLPDGRPGCVMLVADFLPEQPGDEALLLTLTRRGGLDPRGYALPDGRLETLAVRGLGADLAGDPAALVAAVLDQVPEVTPAPLNRLRLGGGSVVLLP